MSNDKYVISPQKGPQTDFLKAEETYVFYGGGAGGKYELFSFAASLERNL